MRRLNDLYGACCMYGERTGVYKVLVGKPEGKRPLGRPKRRLKDLQEEGCGTRTGLIWPRIGTGSRHL